MNNVINWGVQLLQLGSAFIYSGYRY